MALFSPESETFCSACAPAAGQNQPGSEGPEPPRANVPRIAEVVAKSPAQRAIETSTGWVGFGLLLAHYRERARLSLTALERSSGVQWSRLRRLERGDADTPPLPVELRSIARVLGVDPDALVERAARTRRGEL